MSSWMGFAQYQAEKSLEQDNFSVGAVIVRDEIAVGFGYNNAKEASNPCGHAEINALIMACKNYDTRDLQGATVYTTLEPCPMCMYALMIAHVDKIVYAKKDPTGGVVTTGVILTSPWKNHVIEMVESSD